MLAKNETGFAAIAYDKQRHRDGFPMAVVAVRGRYDLFADGSLRLSENQNLIMQDEYEKSPHNSQLLRVSDFVPFKPNTDITVIGYTYPPGGGAKTSWQFGISVAGVKRLLRCHGLRDWLREGTGWRMSQTRPVERVRLDYRYAAGSDFAENQRDSHGANPIGAPAIEKRRPPLADKIPIANIERLDAPITDPFTLAAPAGLSPVPPHWQTRLKFAGDYGEDWYHHRKPQLPQNFDYSFYQTASHGLIHRGFVRGNESIILHNLTSGGGDIGFSLPNIQPVATAFWLDNRQVRMALNLDGIHIDMHNIQAPWRVDFTWRGWLPSCPSLWKFELNSQTLAGDTGSVLKVGVNGLEDEDA